MGCEKTSITADDNGLARHSQTHVFWCGRSDHLKMSTHVHKAVFLSDSYIVKYVSYLCALTREHTHICAERLMDMDSGLNWSPWAAFHTVIEIHLLLGGGVRDFMKEEMEGEKARDRRENVYVTDFRNTSVRRVSRCKRWRMKVISFPFCHYSPRRPENSCCRCHFCYSASAKADIILWIQVSCWLHLFPFKHNLQNNYSVQISDTLPRRWQRGDRRGVEWWLKTRQPLSDFQNQSPIILSLNHLCCVYTLLCMPSLFYSTLCTVFWIWSLGIGFGLDFLPLFWKLWALAKFSPSNVFCYLSVGLFHQPTLGGHKWFSNTFY